MAVSAHAALKFDPLTLLPSFFFYAWVFFPTIIQTKMQNINYINFDTITKLVYVI